MSEVFKYYNTEEMAPSEAQDVDLELNEDVMSEVETDDVDQSSREHNNQLTKGVDSLLYHVDDAYESYGKKKEALKERSKEVGGKALNAAKIVGGASAAVGLTTLGVVVIGAQAGAGLVKSGIDKSKGLAKEFADVSKDFYDGTKDDIKKTAKEGAEAIGTLYDNAKESLSDVKDSVVETVGDRIGKIKTAYSTAKAESLKRRNEREAVRETARQARIEAKNNDRIAKEAARQAATKARDKARQDRKNARKQFVDVTKESLEHKKDTVVGGSKRLANAALGFFKRAKKSGEAAVEAWKSYSPEEVNDNETEEV